MGITDNGYKIKRQITNLMELEILERFQALRASLKPLANQWSSLMDDLISLMKQEEYKDHPNRHAINCEMHAFNTLYRQIQLVADYDSQESVRHIQKKLDDVRYVMQRIKYDSIGDEILVSANDLIVQLKILENAPFLMYRKRIAERERIHKHINALIKATKIAIPYIPLPTKQAIINAINSAITKCVQLGIPITHGIILQLAQETPSTIMHVEVIYATECLTCQYKSNVYGGSDEDVFAPLKCSKCNGEFFYPCKPVLFHHEHTHRQLIIEPKDKYTTKSGFLERIKT